MAEYEYRIVYRYKIPWSETWSGWITYSGQNGKEVFTKAGVKQILTRGVNRFLTTESIVQRRPVRHDWESVDID